MVLRFLFRLNNFILSWYLNCFFVKYNRIKLRCIGATIGKNVNIPTASSIVIDKGGFFNVGDNVSITGHPTTNPLNNHKPIIRVYSGACLEIGEGSGLSSPIIWCSNSVILKKGVGLGGNVLIMDSDAHSLDWKTRSNPEEDQNHCKKSGIVIGEFALIGTGSIILKGVHIGEHSIIGAGSVVTQDVPADCIAAGNPCKVIKYL